MSDRRRRPGEEFPTKVIPARRYICFVDVCTEGLQFCNQESRRCNYCSDYVQDCFTYHQRENCTQYCMDQWLQNEKESSDCIDEFMIPLIFSLVANVLLMSCIAYCHFQPHPYMIYRSISECCYSLFFSLRNGHRYRNVNHIETNSNNSLEGHRFEHSSRRTNRRNRQISAQTFEGNSIETVHLPSRPIHSYRRQNSYPPLRNNADGASLIETTEESHRYTIHSEFSAGRIQNQPEESGRQRVNSTLSTSATFLKQTFPIEGQTTPSTYHDLKQEFFSSSIPLKTSVSLKQEIPVIEVGTNEALNSENRVENEENGRHNNFSKIENYQQITKPKDKFNTRPQHNQQLKYNRKSTSMDVCVSSSKHQLEEMKSHGQNSADSAYVEMHGRSAPYNILNNSMNVNNGRFQLPVSIGGPQAMQAQPNSDDGYETVFSKQSSNETGDERQNHD